MMPTTSPLGALVGLAALLVLRNVAQLLKTLPRARQRRPGKAGCGETGGRNWWGAGELGWGTPR